MNSSDFISQLDPTKNIESELLNVTLEKQYSLLSLRDKLLIFCKMNGYTFIPPSIERMYSDEYFLGGESFFNHGTTLFLFWKDALPKIYPNEVMTAKPFLILSGAIGIGKSTVSRLCLATTYARLLAMRNPYVTLGMTPKPLSAVIFHRSEETAIVEFKRWFEKDVKTLSPFFKNTINNNFKFKIITSGPRGSGGLGSDVIFYIIGEVNFWDNQENALAKVSSSLIRFKSRFDSKALSKVGGFILDSSAKGASGTTEWFLDNTDPRYTWNCHPAHYEVRKNMYEESHGLTFAVFAGDSRYPPLILPKDYKLDETMDPDRVIHVPILLMGEFKANLIKSLLDLSGISTGSSDSFFGGSIEHLMACSKIKNRMPEVITIDFYDKRDRIIDKVMPMINTIKYGTPMWVGLDLSAANGGDMTGVSAVIFEGWKNEGGTRVPKVRCVFTFAVANKDGLELSLFHIFLFLLDLKKRFNIIVSADQAFSRLILQDCERENIPTNGRISTDNVPCEPAIYLKNLINQELIEVPFNKRLQREASDLYYTSKGKVDHPRKAGISKEFDNPDGSLKGSKDTWDSLASACYSLKTSIDAGEEYGYNNGFHKEMEAIGRLTTDARLLSLEIVQEMLLNIF